ncbi:hypothetical protein IWZ03DRAFT_355902 [Phyllosticta citriasiana]|uniref:Uncharacterized protein n=1 Tax=Phyllosticta citriasiana TaxID=595635 RepID=A0ABR1KXJ2_9PEZI
MRRDESSARNGDLWPEYTALLEEDDHRMAREFGHENDLKSIVNKGKNDLDQGEHGKSNDSVDDNFNPSYQQKRPMSEDATLWLGGHDRGNGGSWSAVEFPFETRTLLTHANLAALGRHLNHVSHTSHTIPPWTFYGFKQASSNKASEYASSVKGNLDQNEELVSLSESLKIPAAKLEGLCLQDADAMDSFLQDEPEDSKVYMLYGWQLKEILEGLGGECVWFCNIGSRPGDGALDNAKEPNLPARRGESGQPYHRNVWHGSDDIGGTLSTRGRFRVLQYDVPAHVLDVVDLVKIRPGRDAQFAMWGSTLTPQMMTDQICYAPNHGRSGPWRKTVFKKWLEETFFTTNALVGALIDLLEWIHGRFLLNQDESTGVLASRCCYDGFELQVNAQDGDDNGLRASHWHVDDWHVDDWHAEPGYLEQQSPPLKLVAALTGPGEVAAFFGESAFDERLANEAARRDGIFYLPEPFGGPAMHATPRFLDLQRVVVSVTLMSERQNTRRGSARWSSERRGLHDA